MRRELSLAERKERALQWPIIYCHYLKLLWQVRHQCSPPLDFFEIIKLAWMNTHQYIWNRMRYIECYIPNRKNEAKERNLK